MSPIIVLKKSSKDSQMYGYTFEAVSWQNETIDQGESVFLLLILLKHWWRRLIIRIYCQNWQC